MANNSQFTGIQPLQPPIVGHLVPPQNALPSMPLQFRPAGTPSVPVQQVPPYTPVASQQFQTVGRTNVGVPFHTQQFPFSQPVQQRPPWPGQAGHVLPPPPQPIPMPEIQPNRPVAPVPPHPQQNSQISNNYIQPLQNVRIPTNYPQSHQNAQFTNNYIPGLDGPKMPLASSYNLSTSSFGQLQMNSDSTTQYQAISQTNVPIPSGVQPRLLTGHQSINSVTPVQQTVQQSSVTSAVVPAKMAQPNTIVIAPSDWIEHISHKGKRYYHNKQTKLSSWEKPMELMTAIERADASTDWREITSPAGKKYYYNRVTKQSKWTIPDELKLAREQLKMESFKETQAEKDAISLAPAVVSFSEVNKLSPHADNSSSPAHGVNSSPILVAPVVAVVNPQPVVSSASSGSPVEPSSVTTNAIEVQIPLETVTPTAAASGSIDGSVTSINTLAIPMNIPDNISAQDVVHSVDEVATGDIEEAKIGMGIAGITNITAVEEKTVDQEPLVYENKQDAKNAFRSLLESAKVGSDWNWDQAMRAIINDRRYSALKSLGERKQAFNEFVGEKKKQEAEGRRAKQKKAREDFKKMLEESKDLTTSTRLSKAISIFEDDERFKAVERAKDREDLFEDYISELEKKKRAKALEEHKRNRTEYVEFLKSCDFIKASSQWRKVQDRLEADERCSRLEKIYRLEIFQEFTRELEKEEEEQRKLRMEELRKAERKNRDEFRKLMEGHVAGGTLTAKTHWRDYCMKVKDLPAYLAVSSNSSGSTAKDLFEDVLEELEKQFLEDKDCIKDAMQLRKINLSSTWTLEDFKNAIFEDSSSPPVSDINLKFVFDELHERVREKEEKEAKKRKRRADDFYELLCTFKEISSSARWEDCKPLFEDRQESWFAAEENFFKEIFEKYITELKEKAKEKERKRREDKAKKDKDGKDRDGKKRAKHRRDKERRFESKKGKEKSMKDGTDSENDDRTVSYGLEDNKRSGRDKDKKHRKRHPSSSEMNLDESEKDWSKSSHRHSIDRKKSKQMEQYAYPAEADVESKYKRHKRDHRSGSHKNNDHEEHKDREFVEDGEVW